MGSAPPLARSVGRGGGSPAAAAGRYRLGLGIDANWKVAEFRHRFDYVVEGKGTVPEGIRRDGTLCDVAPEQDDDQRRQQKPDASRPRPNRPSRACPSLPAHPWIRVNALQPFPVQIDPRSDVFDQRTPIYRQERIDTLGPLPAQVGDAPGAEV